MSSLVRSLTKRQTPKNSPLKHHKLLDDWRESKEPIKQGITFYLKYLGSILVEELEDEGESYGKGISAEAIKTIVTMAKVRKKQLPIISITISPSGIKLIDTEINSTVCEMSIHRINFCTADKNYKKVFAYIARSTENETMECKAFLCEKKKIAKAVTLTVANAFALAKEIEDKKEKELDKFSLPLPSPKMEHSVEETKTEENVKPLIEIDSDSSETILPVNVQVNNGDTQCQFEDSFVDTTDSEFSSLAEDRINKCSFSLSETQDCDIRHQLASYEDKFTIVS